MAVSTKKYIKELFSIVPNRYGVTVYYEGKFWENADSFQEAKQDINEVVGIG